MELKWATFLGENDYDQLVGIYMDCFSEHPWYEKFNRLDVREDLMGMSRSGEGISFVALENGLIAGALFSKPLIYAGEVAKFIPKEINKEDVMYVAEVFVRRKFRRKGIASSLLEKFIGVAQDYQYTHIMQRTNFESKMFLLIEKTGHELVGIQEIMSKKVMGGTIAEVPEKRGIFLKKI